MEISDQNRETLAFKISALRYLRWWLLVDRSFISSIRNNGQLTDDQLYELLKAYSVKRCIAGNGMEPIPSLRSAIYEYRDRLGVPFCVPAVVKELSKAIKPFSVANNNTHSLVSKLLWFHFGHPVAIYDSIVRNGLKSLEYEGVDRGYGEFYTAWTDYYTSQLQEHVLPTCRWLHRSSYVKRLILLNTVSNSEVRYVIQQSWFMNRVIDHRLLMHGEDQKRNRVEKETYFRSQLALWFEECELKAN